MDDISGVFAGVDDDCGSKRGQAKGEEGGWGVKISLLILIIDLVSL